MVNKKGLIRDFGFLILLFVALCGGACSEELSENNEQNPDATGQLKLFIPVNHGFATRSSYGVSGDEGIINNLHIYFFDTAGTLKEYRNLIVGAPILSEDGEYRVFSVTSVPAGSYRVAILANMEEYVSDVALSEIDAKDELEKLVLCFQPDKPISARNLPMVAFEDDMEGNKDGLISFAEGESQQINAPLNILCAKVRYTVLFNAETGGFSAAFGDEKPEISGVSVTPVVAATAITSVPGSPEATYLKYESGDASWNFNISKYSYPGDSYPGENGLVNPAADLTEYWSDNGQSAVAWQGVAYLPENLTERPSVLTLSASLNDKVSTHSVEIRGTESTGGYLRRGNMYDIVTRLTNPGKFESEIQDPGEFEASVNIRLLWNQEKEGNLFDKIIFFREDGSIENCIGDIKNSYTYAGAPYTGYEYTFTETKDSFKIRIMTDNGNAYADYVITYEEIKNKRDTDGTLLWVQPDWNTFKSFTEGFPKDKYIEFYWAHPTLIYVQLWVDDWHSRITFDEEFENLGNTPIGGVRYNYAPFYYSGDPTYYFFFRIAQNPTGYNVSPTYMFTWEDATIVGSTIYVYIHELK